MTVTISEIGHQHLKPEISALTDERLSARLRSFTDDPEISAGGQVAPASAGGALTASIRPGRQILDK